MASCYAKSIPQSRSFGFWNYDFPGNNSMFGWLIISYRISKQVAILIFSLYIEVTQKRSQKLLTSADLTYPQEA